MKLKNILFVLLLILSLTRCTQPIKQSVIVGQITMDKEHAEYANSLTLTYSTYGFDNTLYSKVDDKGRFRFAFQQEHPIDMILGYDNKFSKLYLEPGDSLFIQFQADEFPHSIVFSGDNESFNNECLQYHKISRGYFSDYLYNVDSLSMVSSEALLEYIKSQKSQNEIFISEHASRFGWSKKFSRWVLNDLNYEFTYDLALYRGEKNSSFYDYFEFFGIENPNAISNSSYWEFLDEYYRYLFSIENLPFDEFTLAQVSEIIAENSIGSSRDYLLAFTFIGLVTYSEFSFPEDEEVEQFLKHISSSKIRDYLFDFYNNAEQPNREVDLSGDLDEIFSSFLGENVYIKVWAHWCAPCISTMPEFLTLKEQFDDVEFVLIAVDSDKSRIDEILSNFGITDNAYFLNKDQSNQLRTRFNIEGIPCYLIINRKGDIITSSAPAPGDKTLEIFLKGLE